MGDTKLEILFYILKDSSKMVNIFQFHQNVLTWAESLGPTRDPHMTMLATTSNNYIPTPPIAG